MADRLLGRYALGDPFQAPRLTGFAVAIGDLVYWDSVPTSDIRGGAPAGSVGVIKSFASYPWGTSLAATQSSVAPVFAGVCAQRWPVGGNVPPIFGGQDGWLMIYPTGVFEFDCLAGSTFTQFQLVGPDQVAGGGALLPQQVAGVSSKSSAIGRVERAAVNVSKVLVRVFTAEMAPLTNA